MEHMLLARFFTGTQVRFLGNRPLEASLVVASFTLTQPAAYTCILVAYFRLSVQRQFITAAKDIFSWISEIWCAD